MEERSIRPPKERKTEEKEEKPARENKEENDDVMITKDLHKTNKCEERGREGERRRERERIVKRRGTEASNFRAVKGSFYLYPYR